MRIIALGKALDEFRKINPLMPVAEIQAFLMVALEHGHGMTEISDRIGMRQTTTSRWLIEMGDNRLEGDGALGLIQRTPVPTNLRRNNYSLTAKGKRMVVKILNALGENE